MSTSNQSNNGDTQSAEIQTLETYIQLSTWRDTIQGYALTLHSSICEVLRIAFEHRELDLDDDQTYAFNVLVTIIQQLGTIISEGGKS